MAEGIASRRLLSWCLLAAALAGFLAVTSVRDGATRFGQFHDDTIYWNVAGSIAAGKGIVIPSLPDEPVLTKYPPLYSYILSLIWTPLPENEGGVAKAVGLSAVFAVLGLLAAFLQFRKWHSVGELEAAGVVALSACCGSLVALAGVVLSDTLFFALAITALYFSDQEERYGWVGAAIFGGLAVLTRSVGLLVVAGITVNYLLRKQYLRGLFVGLAAVPVVAASAALKMAASGLPSTNLEGYVQTWLYYNDYVGFWRVSMPDWETLTKMLRMNFLELLWTPAEFTLGPRPPTATGQSLWVMFTVGTLSGLYRIVKEDRVHAYHLALLFHVPLILLWNFEIAGRLLLPFLPLFWLGLGAEIRHVGKGVALAVRAGRPALDRAVAAALLALMLCGACWWGVTSARTLIPARATTQSLAKRYEGLIGWIRENSSPEDRLVAIDEGLLYAHTGRRGTWPLAVATDLRYRPSEDRLRKQLELIPDVAEQTGARYAVWTSTDYSYAPPVQARWADWTSGFCLAMSDPAGNVKVYDLRCRVAPQVSAAH